jgi:phosphoenolpyruvate synthase/pyruvate phosphate dikinase
MEDLASAAFAGQHETYLNCAGSDAVLGRIKDCFLSLWAGRAVAYRQQQRFDHQLAAMAVVVQEMIPCEVAGVAFSLNPVSGQQQQVDVYARKLADQETQLAKLRDQQSDIQLKRSAAQSTLDEFLERIEF